MAPGEAESTEPKTWRRRSGEPPVFYRLPELRFEGDHLQVSGDQGQCVEHQAIFFLETRGSAVDLYPKCLGVHGWG